MQKNNDLTGEIFGKLKVLSRKGLDNNRKNSTWICECECGKIIVFTRSNLKRSIVSSCGCNLKIRSREVNVKHGLTNSNLYRSWTDMKTRCLNTKRKGFKNYGGRGIKVCERWMESFENFLEDMGNPEIGMSLERIDNEKGYCKENCKWIPKHNQSKNRRCNVFIKFNSEIILAKDYWEKFYKKYSYGYFKKKLKKGELCLT